MPLLTLKTSQVFSGGFCCFLGRIHTRLTPTGAPTVDDFISHWHPYVLYSWTTKSYMFVARFLHRGNCTPYSNTYHEQKLGYEFPGIRWACNASYELQYHIFALIKSICEISTLGLVVNSPLCLFRLEIFYKTYLQ